MATAVNVGRMMTRPDAQRRKRLLVVFNPQTNRLMISGVVVQSSARMHAQEVHRLDDGAYLVRRSAGPDDFVIFAPANVETDLFLSEWLGC